jgi:aspartyl protease family protein
MKFAPFILITTMFAALVAWFAPGDAADQAGIAPAAAQQEASELAMVQEDVWGSGEVVLNRARDGHFYAEVTVDANSALMLVDTGASMVALTAEDADALGVAWEPDDVQPVARGASGLVHGVRVTLPRVQLGHLEVENVQAIVVPEGLGVSLLGQSFLSQIQRVEVELDRMVLGG